jgi:ribosomal protein L37E
LDKENNMGLSSSIHIGPYMLVTGKKYSTEEYTIRGCSNKECLGYKGKVSFQENKKFCSECGFELKSRICKEKVSITPYDLMCEVPYEEELCDELVHVDTIKGGKDVFMPNESTPFSKKRGSIKGYDNSVVDLMDYDKEAEIEWFKERYKRAIEIFKIEFGQDSVELRWGVIQWVN